MAKTNYTSKAMELLRADGYRAEVIERFIPNGYFGFRKDFLGFGDILAFRPGSILLVQSTGSAFSARKKKILNECRDDALLWLACSPVAGIRLIAWAKRKIKRGGIAFRYEARIHDFVKSDFYDESNR